MLKMNTMNFFQKYIFLSSYLFFSLSLLFVGEYTTALFFQIFLLGIFFSNRILLYIFYIPLLLFILLKFFATLYYPLYFLNLISMIMLVYMKDIIISVKMSMPYMVYLLGLFFIYDFLSEERYEFYLDLNIVDSVHSSFNEVGLILTLLHILILVNVGIIKKKYF